MKKMAISCLLVVLMLVGMIPSVMALEGPVNSPLLGVSVSDTDPGDLDNKEQWGRVGGRTFGFTVYQASEYDQLKWRPLDVGIAFDGAINAALETLSYNSIVDGKAVWVGQTQVEVLNEFTQTYQSRTVNTEFRLTVRDASDSLVSFALMDGIPTVDLKALTPNAADEVLFTATLEMRAQMPSYDSITGICPYSSPEPIAGDFYPALNVYDCLHTNPNLVRPAITMFDAGFFYEIEIPSFGLAEHDAHMEDLVGGVQTSVDVIYGWIDFLYNDWPGRISNINDNLASIGGTLNTVFTTLSNQEVTLNNVFTTVGEINTKVDSCTSDPEEVLNKLDDLNNSVSKIDEGVSKIPDFNLLMFGLTDFIQDPELQGYVPAVLANSPLYQKLDALTETLTEVNDNTNANTQGISEVLSQSQQNAQTLNLVNDQTNVNTEIVSDTLAQCQQNAQTLTQVNDNTNANTQGISDTLAQSQQNAQTLAQISSQGQQYADIIASLTSQLQESNAIISNLNVAMGSMYTEEELDQAIVDACPGKSEYPGQGPPEKKQSCIEEITVLSPAGEEVTAIGDEVEHPNTKFVDSEENSVKIHTSCSKCIYVGQEVDGWTITEIVDDGKLAEKCD